MQSRINYQLETDRILAQLPEDHVPALFLHSCCAPCSSYVLEYLSQYFNITLFFYNPNISPESEYLHRKAELKRLVQELPLGHPVRIVDGDYVPERFYALAKVWKTCRSVGCGVRSASGIVWKRRSALPCSSRSVRTMSARR